MSDYWSSTGQSTEEDKELDPQTGELKSKPWAPLEPSLESQGVNVQALQQGPQTEEEAKQDMFQPTPQQEEEAIDFGNVPMMEGSVDDLQIAGYEEIPTDPEEIEMQKAMDREAELEGTRNKIKFERDELYGIRDKNGELVRDLETGEVIRRDLSGFEKIDNSMQGMMVRMRQLIPNMQITVGTLAEKLIPKPLLDDYIQNGDASVLANMMPQTGGANLSQLAHLGLIPNVDEAIHEKKLIQEEQGETGSIVKGIKEGDIAEVMAGGVNAMSSFLPSMAMAAVTGGTSTFMEFFGDSYVGYNEAVAAREGKTLEQLREADMDSFTAPAVFAGVNTLSELVGLKGAGQAILKNVGSSAGKKVTNVLLAGNKEGLTELFQTSMDAARDTLATTEDAAAAGEAFGKTLMSEEGLESYLQGFVGGSGFAGGGSVDKNDLNQLRKAASAMQAPVDTKKLEDALAKKVQLQDMINSTNDTELQANYRRQMEDLDNMMKGEIIHANGLVRKMTPKQLKDAATIQEARDAMMAEQASIISKADKGEITRAEKLTALQGLSAAYKAQNAKLQEMAMEVEQQPTAREKDGSLKPKSQWSMVVAPKIESIAKKNLTDNGKLTEQGIWDILQTKEVNNVVDAAINKRFAAQGQQFDATMAEELKSEMLYGGKQSIHGLLKSWDASKGASPASYVYGQIQNKLTGKLAKLEDQTQRGAIQIDKQSDQGHGLQLESEPTLEDQTDTRSRTATEVAADLGVAGPQMESMMGKMEVLAQPEGLPSPEEKGFEQAVTKRFRDQLTPDVKKAMGRGQNYVDYLTNNYERLVDAHPTRTLAKRNNESRNWVEKRPTLEEFLDFYLPKDANGNKRAKDESHRKNALAELVAESIGTKMMKETMEAQNEATFRDNVNTGIDTMIDGLTKMLGDRNALHSNPLGVPVNLMIGGLRATKAAFNAGMDMGNAIKKGYEKVADKVDFEAFKNYIESQIKALKSPTSWAEMSQQRVEQEIKLAAQDVQKEINGFNYDQFQEDTSIAEDDFAAQSQATDKILDQYMPADAEYRKTVNTKDPDQFEAGRNWISNTLTKYFPKEFFQQGMFANAGKSAAERGFFATSKEDVDGLAESAQSDPNSVWNKNGRYIYGNKDLDDVKANWGKIQENNKNNWAAFENMWQTFDQMIKDDINNAPMIAAFLKGAQNSQNHISRTAAPLIAYSQDKGGHPRYEEEHSLPQSAVSRYLMQSIMSGGDINSALENVQKNFFQVALNKDDDHKLKKKGEYNYSSKMPEGWRMSDNTWARYFNANVNGNNGGIDPNSITFFNTGKTVAETYGAGTTATKTGDVKAAQQAVVAEQVGDRFEQFLDSAISVVGNVAGKPGTLQSNFAAIPAHILVGGLRATKLAYRGARDLAAAIEAGYNSVKDYMSRQEWADFTKQAIQEVKNEQSPAQSYLATASEGAIQKEQERRQLLQQVNKLGGEIDQAASTDQILSKINDLTKVAKETATSKTTQDFDRIMNSKKPSKLNIILNEAFVGSEVEDFKGLMYRILPGKEGGDFLQEKFLNPYTEALMKINARKLAGRKQMKDALKKFGSKRLGELDLAEIKKAHNSGDLSQFDQPTQQLIKDLGQIADGQFMDQLNDGDKTLEQQYLSFVNGVQRKEALQPFWENVEATLLDENGNIRQEIKDRMALPGAAILGGKYKYAEALKNSLDRMRRGTNRPGRSQDDKAAGNLLNIVNDAAATVMHYNMRSAALQLLSSLNYVRASGFSLFDAKNNIESMKKIINSDYVKNRMDGKAWDIVASDIADSQRKGWFSRKRKQLLDAGFLPTQYGDKIAIAVGGAPYLTSLIKKHNGNEELAMRDFIQFTEENQQSADPSKISQIQSGNLGRLLFAFLNTPFQYTRLTKRAGQDLINGRGSVGGNLAKMAYFSAIQTMLFESARGLISEADLLGYLEDEEDRDEEEKIGAKKIEMAIDGWKGTNLKTMGYLGAGAEVVRQVYNEYERQAKSNRINPEKFAMAALKISPPVSRKASDLVGIGRSLWKQNRGTGKAKVENIARIGDLINLPTYRYYQKLDNLMAMAEDDKHAYEDALRLMGWTDWSFGINPNDRGKEGPKFKAPKVKVPKINVPSPVKREWDAEDSPFKFLGSMSRGIFGAARRKARAMQGGAQPGGPNDKFAQAGARLQAKGAGASAMGGIGRIAAAARGRGNNSPSAMAMQGQQQQANNAMMGDQQVGMSSAVRGAMGGALKNFGKGGGLFGLGKQKTDDFANNMAEKLNVDFGRLSATPNSLVQNAQRGGAAQQNAVAGANQQTSLGADLASQPGGNPSLTPQSDMQNAQDSQSSQQLDQMNQLIQQNQQTLSDVQTKADELNKNLENQMTEIGDVRQAAADGFTQAAESIQGAGGAPAGAEAETPLMKLGNGELGQAHNDGTIEVDPSLKGEERERVIAHEEEHVKQMKEDGLDYDDNAVYFRNIAYERKDGKIKFRGKWLKEGDKSLPWEKLAYEAEEKVKSPVKNTGDEYRKKAGERRKKLVEKHGDDSYIDPNRMDYKRKQKLWELGVPQNESEVVTSAKDWTRNWENDPETMRRWKETAPHLSEGQLAKQATRQALTATRGFEEGERESDEHWGRYKPYKDEMILAENAPEEIAIHELAHAGYDLERGAHVKDIVGPVQIQDAFGNRAYETEDYINNPQETGAYLQQIRGQLGLKPGQEVTPEMLEKADDEYNLYLRAVRQSGKEDKLIEALNTVAMEEQPQMRKNLSLDDLYANQDSALTRQDDKKKKKKGKKKVEHSVYMPGYTKHFVKGQGAAAYHQGLGGSEGGQGGLLYQQKRTNPGKMGGTAYTAGAMQNSYGDPIVVGTVGRDWDLGKGWSAGIHGGATHGYQKSYREHEAKANARGRTLRGDAMTRLGQDSPVMPVVTGTIGKKFGDSGFGAKAIVNPMYVNAGLTYDFGKRKKKKSKKKRK